MRQIPLRTDPLKGPVLLRLFENAIITFPKSFLWGASTASYQTEGGNHRSALKAWEKTRGWEECGEAARSWELFDEDLRLLKSLNATAYRFSLEWSRVEPEPGRFDREALARYASWARALAAEGIRPLACLHHFSEPAWLLHQHPRGWAEDGVREAFLRYCAEAGGALKGLVPDWLVFNEPMVFLVGAYGVPYFPPGGWGLLNPRGTLLSRVVPNAARAHNEARDLLKRLDPACRVGVAHNVAALDPARPGDEEARGRWDWFMHRNFLDLTKDRLDFIGLNYYTRVFVSRCRLPGAPLGAFPGHGELEERLGPLLFRLLGGRRGDRPRSGMGWEVVPEGLGRVARELHAAYAKPLLVTENGMAAAPGLSRAAFIREHLDALARARAEGVPVEGYLHWSLMDNYEWGSYRPRFGLHDRARRPADGADYYARVCASGAL